MKAKTGFTLVTYTSEEKKRSGIFLPSDDQRERARKSESRVLTNMVNKPKNMYRWGVVVDSDIVPTGSRVYYSRFDTEDVVRDGVIYNSIKSDFVLAYEKSTD